MGAFVKKNFIILFVLLLPAFSKSNDPKTYFFHGIVDNETQVKPLCKKTVFGDIISENFPDASTCDSSAGIVTKCLAQITSQRERSAERPNGRVMNLEKMYLGQGPDIDHVLNTIKSYPTENAILYGASRGASTIVSALGKMHDHEIKNVKAVILESPVADMLSSVDFYSAQLGIRLPERLFRAIFYQYPAKPYTPLQAIKDIKNKNIPIFIFTTAKDTVIDPAQPWILYRAFLQAGFKNVYISESPQGKHCKMHLEDQSIIHNHYYAPVQAFYKKYNLHKNDHSNFQCDNINLKDFQPSVEEAQEKIDFYKKKRALLFKKNLARNTALIGSMAIAVICLIWRVKRKKQK